MTQSIPNELAAVLGEYDTVYQLAIHWGEQDANGHVNHGVPIRWLESARIHYIRDNGVMQALHDNGVSPIIAAIELRYRRQLTFPDQAIIGTRVTELGRTSMTIEQGIFSGQQRALAIEAAVKVVMFDPEAQRPRRIPSRVREIMDRSD